MGTLARDDFVLAVAFVKQVILKEVIRRVVLLVAIPVSDGFPTVATAPGPGTEVIVIDPMMVEFCGLGNVNLQSHILFRFTHDRIVIQAVLSAGFDPDPFVSAIGVIDDGTVGNAPVGTRQTPDFTLDPTVFKAKSADSDIIAAYLYAGIS